MSVGIIVFNVVVQKAFRTPFVSKKIVLSIVNGTSISCDIWQNRLRHLAALDEVTVSVGAFFARARAGLPVDDVDAVTVKPVVNGVFD